MIDAILDHKWFILIGSEVAFWLLAGSFLVLRYWLGLRRTGLAVLALILTNELLVAALGFLDYGRTGEFASYQVVVLIFLGYALTFGKQDFRRLDARIERAVASWKGRTPSPRAASGRTVLSGRERARDERRGWYEHLAVFVVGQATFFALGESWPAMILTGELPVNAVWTGRWPGVEASAPALASRLWCILLAVDFVWSFSYTVFPKRGETSVAAQDLRRG